MDTKNKINKILIKNLYFHAQKFSTNYIIVLYKQLLKKYLVYIGGAILKADIQDLESTSSISGLQKK